jgi:TM2 domain-containing membrane protein YozV
MTVEVIDVKATDPQVSPRSRLAALLFCILLGIFGAHRFYVGKHGTAVTLLLLSLVTLGTVGALWAIVDAVLIALGSFRDKQGRRLLHWLEPR